MKASVRSGAFTDRRHAHVSEKSVAAMEGEFCRGDRPSATRGRTKEMEKWNPSLQVPAVYL